MTKLTTEGKGIKIKHLHQSACGYGLDIDKFTLCLESIPDELFDDFVYTLYRISEKSGQEGFSL